jgi:hypothetical protein
MPDEMIALMWAHPGVCGHRVTDGLCAQEFHAAPPAGWGGFRKANLFGSDPMVWPEAIENGD